jgi:hypothetical protein
MPNVKTAAAVAKILRNATYVLFGEVLKFLLTSEPPPVTIRTHLRNARAAAILSRSERNIALIF